MLVPGLKYEVPEPTAVYGPPVHIAYDERKRPTKAAEGFARNQGVDVSDLKTHDERRVVYVLKQRESLRDALPGLLEGIVSGLSFGKSQPGTYA